MLLQSVAVNTKAARTTDGQPGPTSRLPLQPSETSTFSRQLTPARLVLLTMPWLGGALGYVVATWERSRSEAYADVGYLQDMISHHEQALEMSNLELVNGSSPEVQIFAREDLVVSVL